MRKITIFLALLFSLLVIKYNMVNLPAIGLNQPLRLDFGDVSVQTFSEDWFSTLYFLIPRGCKVKQINLNKYEVKCNHGTKN